jgi:hypothetical protein
MKTILIILALFASPVVADSETYLEIGAGKNSNILGCSICWEDSGGVGAYLAIRNEWSNGFFIQFTHYSQYDVGKPFNDKSEATLDHFGVGMRWKIR